MSWLRNLLLFTACAVACITAQSRVEIANILKRNVFSIHFSNETIPITEALQLLDDKKPYSQDASLQAAHTDGKFQMYRITDTEAYVCHIPLVKSDVGAEQNKRVLPNKETDAILSRGLSLLAKLRGKELQNIQSYFSHVLRYGNHILQYPLMAMLDNDGVPEVDNRDTLPEGYYLMGVWDSLEGIKNELVPLYNTPSADLDDDVAPPYEGNAFFIQQVWNGGTVCDLNGLPRTTTVKVCTHALTTSITVAQIIKF